MALYKEDLVVVNKYSRPGTKLTAVKGIVIHWTANPGASDTAHQSFFDGNDGGGSRYAGAHIFVDSDSAVVIIPLNEVAYQANDHACRVQQLKPNANFTSIGIEMCVEKDGTIHPNTVKRTAEITASLCKKFKLTEKDIFRHFDVTGKNCPAPWVTKPAEFTAFKKKVATLIKPVVKPKPPVYTRLLHRGMIGEDVKLVQKKLGIPADGVFGNDTENAVILFQKSHKLTPDGLLGKVTWDTLF